jgi:hypothetical protein
MDDEGVQFPLRDGKRSTQRASREVFAHAAAAVDDGLASAIRAERAWRSAYPQHLRRLTERAAANPDAGVAIAQAGLDRMHAAFEFTHAGTTIPLADAVSAEPGRGLTTRTIQGEGKRPVGLAVPYHGVQRHGDDLLRVASDWRQRGIVEPPVVAALERLTTHPEWLDASDLCVAVLGAGAEMAPTEPLLRWGADVVAVDLPRAGVWRHLEDIAARGAGRLHIPVDDGTTLGADLITDAPRIRAWLQRFERPLLLGNYAYADGATFARLSVAADAVCRALQQRNGVSVVCLATPTDAFAVPWSVVHETRERAGRWPAMLARGISRVSLGRLLVPRYRTTVRADNGEELGIADSLVLQQGPNYALAKRVQRWRAIATHASGAFAAIHVAPPTRTRSVLKNRVLAAAYAGVPMFGIETFEPATSRTLMAALLIHDLRMYQQAPPGANGLRAEHELTAGAVHGGLWRIAWEPRTALPFAVLRGAPALLRPAG